METLVQIWERLSKDGYETDKGSVHSYLPIYETVFAPYREAAKNVLEIGIFKGDSLRLWEEYFINAEVHGVDCDEQPHGGMADLRPMIAEGNHNIHIIDAVKWWDYKGMFNTKWYDIIIEDAGHHVEQQLELYKVFKPALSKGGLYIIEDIQNIDETTGYFETIDQEKTITIIDNRHIKGRYDDVLVIITDK